MKGFPFKEMLGWLFVFLGLDIVSRSLADEEVTRQRESAEPASTE
jgi:hypothetical protein